MEQRWVLTGWSVGVGKRGEPMTRNRQKTARPKPEDTARAVPLVVPHVGADAGSDFESAFDVVRRDGKIHKLWQTAPSKQDVRRAS
jgi:hypothetical protein